MPLSHLPFGASAWGVPLVPQQPMPGLGVGFGGKGNVTAVLPAQGPGSQVFFVNSALASASDAAVSNGGDPLRPFKTINFALGRTIANNGDVIYVGPGHVETIAAAAGWPNAAAALKADGVTIYFLGNEIDRAQINFTTATTAQMIIGANNMALVGARFVNSIDALAQGLKITGTDCKLIGCEWFDSPALNTVIQIITTATAKRLSIIGYHYYEDQTGGGTQKTEAIRIVGGDNHLLQELNIAGNFSTGVINNITTAFINCVVKWCTLNNISGNITFAQLTTSAAVFLGTILMTTGADAVTDSTLLNAADMASGQMISGAGTAAIIDFSA